LHVLRARLLGGIRNKAARGELRRNLPVGFVWGEQDGEICLHPDESVRAAIQTVFTRFAELGSVRRVWLWFRSEGLSLPLRMHYGAKIRWVDPSYIAVYISSPIRSTQAPTHMARAVMRSPSTLPAYARSARANCRARNGRCSSRTTMRALSIGTPMRLIARGSPPTLIHARINQVAVP